MKDISVNKLTEFSESLKSDKAFKFLKTLEKEFSDAKIYLVGGIVRDQIMDIKSKDIDFVISKVSAKSLKEFLSKYGSVELVGASFGVFKFMPVSPELAEAEGPEFAEGTEALDVALPRTEISTGGGGYRDFDVQSDPNLSIESDLSRRDLTINAMAYDIKLNKLIDPYNGLKDIKNKIIKAVGDPYERFSEDYSRILRAIRFAVKFEFNIEEKTWEAIKNDAPKILNTRIVQGQKKEIVPYETISKEFLKSINTNVIKTFDLYEQSNLLALIFPEIKACQGVPQEKKFHQEGDVYSHTKLVLEKLPPTASLRLKLAALFHDIGKPQTTKTPEQHGVNRIRSDEHAEFGAKLTKKICQRLKFTNQSTDEITWLVNYHMFFVCGKVEDMRPNTIKKYFIDNPALGDDLLALYYADTAASYGKYQADNLKRIEQVKSYIANMRQQFKKSHTKTFRHIINGNDIIKEFSLKPGKEIGNYLEKADKFILDFITKNGKEPSKKDIILFLGY